MPLPSRSARGEAIPPSGKTSTDAPPSVEVGQVYERVPMLLKDGSRWKITGRCDHTRIRITQVPEGRKRTHRYVKLDPKPMGNGRRDRGEHTIALTTLAGHYLLVDERLHDA